MKVLDLQCQSQHLFEGWFGSEDDFQRQLQQGLIECPLCGDKQVHKMLSAPRLNLRAQHAPPSESARDEPATAAAPEGTSDASALTEVTPLPTPSMQSLQAAWLNMARQVMAQTEDVGDNFATEARRIHQGEAVERGIRGQATAQKAVELLEEGIGVLPLLLPDAVKNTLQ